MVKYSVAFGLKYCDFSSTLTENINTLESLFELHRALLSHLLYTAMLLYQSTDSTVHTFWLLTSVMYRTAMLSHSCEIRLAHIIRTDILK